MKTTESLAHLAAGTLLLLAACALACLHVTPPDAVLIGGSVLVGAGAGLSLPRRSVAVAGAPVADDEEAATPEPAPLPAPPADPPAVPVQALPPVAP